MNSNDKLKFIDVFVDVTKYGTKAPCTMSDIDVVLDVINEEYLNAWEKYLSTKIDEPEFEDGDVWDNWYDNLTYESISDRDIQVFDLPTQKIQVALGNDVVFMKTVHNAIKNFYADAVDIIKNSSNPKDYHVAYYIDKQGIFVEVGTNDCKSPIYRKLASLYDNLTNIDISRAIIQYNEAQGKDNYHIKELRTAKTIALLEAASNKDWDNPQIKELRDKTRETLEKAVETAKDDNSKTKAQRTLEEFDTLWKENPKKAFNNTKEIKKELNKGNRDKLCGTNDLDAWASGSGGSLDFGLTGSYVFLGNTQDGEDCYYNEYADKLFGLINDEAEYN